MGYSKGKAALGIAGLVATLVAGGAVVWGRVRSVEAPRPATWAGAMPVCAGDGVDRVALLEAVREVEAHGFDVRLLPRGPCEVADGLVAVNVDPTLDAEAGLGGGIDRDPDPMSTTWDLTHVIAEGGRIRSATVRLHPRQDATGDVHMLLHALGWLHPVNPPTGHVLHPHDPSLRDWRGVEGP